MNKPTTELPYPHRRNDCDSCGEYDADMAARYDGLRGRPVRWCQRCAGRVLSHLVLTGHTVTVTSLEDTGAQAVNGRATSGGPVILGVAWTVDDAEQVLRHMLPGGREFLRVLVNGGGTVTAAHMKERLGLDQLSAVSKTVNAAARKLTGYRLGGERRRLVESRPHPNNPRSVTVYDYELPAELVPLFDQALQRLDADDAHRGRDADR